MGLIPERHHGATKSILSKLFLRFIFCTEMKSEQAPDIDRRLNVHTQSEKLNFTKQLVGFRRDLEDNQHQRSGLPSEWATPQPREGKRRDQEAAAAAKKPTGRACITAR